MLPGRLQKYSGSLYFLLTFKELVSSLLDLSVKLLRFLIKWKSSLWWKRLVGVEIVSLTFPCLLQKGKIFDVKIIQNHGSAVLLSISNCHSDHRELPYHLLTVFRQTLHMSVIVDNTKSILSQLQLQNQQNNSRRTSHRQFLGTLFWEKGL